MLCRYDRGILVEKSWILVVEFNQTSHRSTAVTLNFGLTGP